MKTIYNVAVLMDSQETCDRMKQLCLDNGLPIWDDKVGFEYDKKYKYFRSVSYVKEFFISCRTFNRTLVTESEFIELLKNHKG
jgi:hypothetical protein